MKTIFESTRYRMRKSIANIITGLRILGSILMLFCPMYSLSFYIAYLLCGFSDMVDGSISRMTNTESEFGAKLDTVADFIFMIVSLTKWLPEICIPNWLWIWICGVSIIKIRNIVWGYVFAKKLIVMHTGLNKATGLVLFLLPLTLPFFEPTYSVVLACCMAGLAAIQEWHMMKAGREIV